MDVELDFEKRHRLIREIVETIVLTVLIFLLIRIAFQNFTVDGFSMEPNFHDKELVQVDKWSYFFHPPARGDVIVFDAPPEPGTYYIKRVIGLPGDVITVQDINIYVNGKLLKDTFVDPKKNGLRGEQFANRVVPPDAYFVLGDHRNDSSDSRTWGCLPKQNIVGRAALIYWPFGQDNIGLVPGVNAVFDNVPVPPAVKGLKSCPIVTNGKIPTDPIYTSTTRLDLNLLFLVGLPGLFVIRPGKRLWRRPSHQH